MSKNKTSTSGSCRVSSWLLVWNGFSVSLSASFWPWERPERKNEAYFKNSHFFKSETNALFPLKAGGNLIRAAGAPRSPGERAPCRTRSGAPRSPHPHGSLGVRYSRFHSCRGSASALPQRPPHCGRVPRSQRRRPDPSRGWRPALRRFGARHHPQYGRPPGSSSHQSGPLRGFPQFRGKGSGTCGEIRTQALRMMQHGDRT